jgi:serine/threonine protein kinase
VNPTQFGPYLLLHRIGVGGMAEVFRARRSDGDDRLVAVKRILSHIADDEEFVEMFIAEAKLTVQLHHPNITQVHDLGRVDDTWFMALELVHGRDLRAIFERCRTLGEPLPIPLSCWIVMKVCEALDYAHRNLRLVHRDINPQNILVSYEGEVKLTDFGIANAGRVNKARIGVLAGKLSHMSPEQVRGLPVDQRSDIFSLGIVLHELLTGERLFDGATELHTLELIRKHTIPRPRALNPRVSPGLEQIVLRALAQDSEDRYPRAGELCDAIAQELQDSGQSCSIGDLADWMSTTFARELAQEREQTAARW